MSATPSARFCANCGVQLFKPSFDAGQCLSCGNPITDTISAAEAQAVAVGYQHGSKVSVPVSGNAGLASDERMTDPDPNYGKNGQPPSKRRRGAPGWVFFPIFLVVLILLLVVLSRFISHGSTMGQIAPNDTPNPIATMAPMSGTTPFPGVRVTPGPTLIPGSTPLPGKGTVVPTVPVASTPTAVIGPTATPAPGAPPSIVVSQYTFSPLVCLGSSITFNVTNGGGGILNFQVTSDNVLYHISPSSGSLAAGQSESVTVTLGATGGHVYVTATGVANSQTITIKCA